MLPARSATRPVIWLSRVRPVPAAARAPLQSAEAAARSVCQSDRRLTRVERCAFRLPHRQSARRPVAGSAQQRERHAEVPGDRSGVLVGQRPQPAHAVARHHHLRDARARLHQAESAGPAATSRHLRGARHDARHRVPEGPGRHGRRADARPLVPQRPAPGGEGPPQLLGLQLDRLLRAASGLLLVPAGGPRVQDDGQVVPLGRHRGDPRRGLQPHRRRQPSRSDAELPRHRQRRVLPAAARRPALLHGLHRLRQHAEHAASTRAANDHGQPALLDHRDARRRLPLRPRRGAGARAARGRPPRRVLRHHSSGPGDLAGEADRRAVGSRRRRLPGGTLPGRLDGMERQVSRRDSRLLERRGRSDRRPRLSRRRLQRSVRAQRPTSVRERQLRHRARRLHAARPRELQRQAQRGEQGREPRRRESQPQLELRRRRPDRRPGDPRTAAAPDAQPARVAPVVAGRADAAGGR